MIARAPFAVLLVLTGCAADGPQRRYPSLAPRAVEQRGFEEPAATPVAAPAADPALDAKIAEATAGEAVRSQSYNRARSAAEAAVTAAVRAPAGSEAWLNAQMALGDLDVLRAEASEAATSLETFATDRAVAGQAAYPALDAAAAAARARVDAIDADITALNARLKR